jgi:hypothetical protein
MSQYTDDGAGGLACPDCAHERGEGHADWCRNPDNPANAGLTLEEIHNK